MPLKFEAPSSDLQRELNEVAKKALALDDYVLGANVLPPEFPTDQVRTLCQSLGSLRYGTAEGCREPLVYARNRLPSIRREHISSDDAKIVSQTDDSSPLILRGEELDRRLSELAISVVTALDQYQSDSSEVLQEPIDAAGGVDPSAINGLGDAIEKSQVLEKELGEASQTIDQIKNPNSKTANDLKRQLEDAKNHTSVARAEISMPSPRVNWLKPVLAVVDALPNIIRKTGHAIEATSDIARPLVKRWDEFWANLNSFLLDEMKSVGATLRIVADEIERLRSPQQYKMSANAGELVVEGSSANFSVEKTRQKRPGGFAPQSSPIKAVQAFREVYERPGQMREDLVRSVGRNALRDLAALGLIRSTKRKIYPVPESIVDYELTVKSAVSNTESYRAVRDLLIREPRTTSGDIASVVAGRIGRNWLNPETRRRYGMALRRWTIWVEPHLLDPSSSSEAYALVVSASTNQVGKGRPRKITDAKARQLLELWAKGHTKKEIAEKMDLSVSAVGNWLRKLDSD